MAARASLNGTLPASGGSSSSSAGPTVSRTPGRLSKLTTSMFEEAMMVSSARTASKDRPDAVLESSPRPSVGLAALVSTPPPSAGGGASTARRRVGLHRKMTFLERKRSQRLLEEADDPAGVVLDFVRGLRKHPHRGTNHGSPSGSMSMTATVSHSAASDWPPGKTLQERFEELLNMVQPPRHGPGTEHILMPGHDTKQYGRDLVERERLQIKLLHTITAYHKRRGTKEWCQPVAHVAFQRAHDIIQAKRQAAALGEAVRGVIRQRESEGEPAREPEETLHDRRKRMEKFWEEYHATFRRIETPGLPAGSKAKSPIASARGSLKPAAPTPQGAWRDSLQSSPSSPSGSILLLRTMPAAGTAPGAPSVKGSMLAAMNERLAATASGVAVASSSPAALRARAEAASSPPMARSTSAPTLHQGDSFAMQQAPRRDPIFRHCQEVLHCGPKCPQLPSTGAPEYLQKRYLRNMKSRGFLPKLVPQPPTCSDIPASPTRDYLWECESSGIVPSPIPFVTGHSLKMSAWDRVLVDNDLIAVVSVLPGMSRIEEADLEGNSSLTDRSLVPFLDRFFGDIAHSSLRRLSLKGCRQAGQGTLEQVVRLLSEDQGSRKLLHLDLGGIEIAAHLHPKLCGAIRIHPTLRKVCLADVGLGYKAGAAMRDIADLLGSYTVQELDIGWNCFTADVFRYLAEQLLETQRLKCLSIANCSAATSVQGDAPVLYFLELLSNDRALTELDISLNRINFCGALVLEDSLEYHPNVRKLDIAQNPLGVLGMRNMLRLLSRSTAGLTQFDCNGCSRGPTEEATDMATTIFNATHPGGRYTLYLIRPYHRAILRMLYKSAERFGISPKDAFMDISYNEKPPYRHPEKNKFGVWQVPTKGVLQITFGVEKGMEAAFEDMAKAPFATLMERHYDLTRLRPALSKVVSIFVQWKSMAGHTLEQLVLLTALSKDFRLPYPQVDQFSREPTLFSEFVRRCLHCVTGGAAAKYLTLMLTPTLGQFIENLRSCEKLLNFNIENPTGHYKLQLENCSDYAVAEQVLLIDRWESSISRKLGHPPVSQKGDYTRVRNERYEEHKLHGVQTIAEWRLPTQGQLELDYVSARRARGLVSLDLETFDKLLVALHLSTCGSEDRVRVMRAVSHTIGLTAFQLRELMGMVVEDYMRAELFVCFILRVVDIHNEKVFRVRFASNPELMKKLRNRLGEVTLFPFMQPEQGYFSYDLSVHDERLAASLLIYIAARESENFRNIRNPKYVKADGTLDRQFETTGISRSWEDFSKIYDSGTFSCSYACSPADVQFEKRVKLFETYAQFKVEVPKDKVLWWAALTEAPPDVLEFLEFLIMNFDDVWEAFRRIDGPCGNGAITLREFEESMSKTLGCYKFKGPNEKQRIANIFRYLDPSGDGDVSREEWSVLDHLWREMEHSMREFVQFLERTYSGEEQDFLDVAWGVFDVDDKGYIDEQDWVDKVLTELEYFGPSQVIFRFLDKDDEGTISLEEFHSLDAFRRTPSPRGPVKQRRKAYDTMTMSVSVKE